MSSVKQLDKGAISEVKLKRSPTVNRIQKKTESLNNKLTKKKLKKNLPKIKMVITKKKKNL